MVESQPSLTFTDAEKQSLSKLLGLVILGEQVAAKTYGVMGQLDPRYGDIMKKFGNMEGLHAAWFHDLSKKMDVKPDIAFAQGELGYLKDQVDEYKANKDFDALAIVQGFIVECMAVASYEPFLDLVDRMPESAKVVRQTIEDEQYHLGWIEAYLRLRYYDAQDEFATKVKHVNQQGVDCVGGTLINIANALGSVGVSGSQCTATMIDMYTLLLEKVGMDPREATQDVMKLFSPLMKKYKSQKKAEPAHAL